VCVCVCVCVVPGACVSGPSGVGRLPWRGVSEVLMADAESITAHTSPHAKPFHRTTCCFKCGLRKSAFIVLYTFISLATSNIMQKKKKSFNLVSQTHPFLPLFENNTYSHTVLVSNWCNQITKNKYYTVLYYIILCS